MFRGQCKDTMKEKLLLTLHLGPFLCITSPLSVLAFYPVCLHTQENAHTHTPWILLGIWSYSSHILLVFPSLPRGHIKSLFVYSKYLLKTKGERMWVNFAYFKKKNLLNIRKNLSIFLFFDNSQKLSFFLFLLQCYQSSCDWFPSNSFGQPPKKPTQTQTVG